MSDNKRMATNPLTGLNALPQSTPIPPSLQAKMAAFANRGANHADPNSLLALAPVPSPHRPPPTAPSRRARPNLNLRDIDPSFLPSHGPAAAGLGPGRPSLFLNDPPRRPSAGNFGSPFSNFSKIVYVSIYFFYPFSYFSPQ